MAHLDNLLTGAEVVLDDQVLDQIDKIVPPGTEVGLLGPAYVPSALAQSSLRRRALSERAAI